MGSSLQFCSPSLLLHKPLCSAPLIRPNPFSYSRVAKYRQFCSLTSSSRSNLEVSWIQAEGSSIDEFGGWFVSKKPETESRNGVPKYVLAVVGASVAVVLATFTYFSFSKRGLKFQFGFPFDGLHDMSMSSKSQKVTAEVTDSTVQEVNQASETKKDDKSNIEPDFSKSKVNNVAASGGNKRVIVPVAADPIQQEAVDVLKKLKIIENDASADELCTRREYARWFVKANSMLERNPKHKILPMLLIAGSTMTAFDDLFMRSVLGPLSYEFAIKALGEAGIIFSKLSTVNPSRLSDTVNSDGQERFDFSPESFISRFDVVNWKAMLEYPFSSEIKHEMLRTKVGILDLSASSLDASPQLLMDLMAGDNSIVRRVFGNIRRLQPQKPVTKAQAAVALISGRMAEMIKTEISRLEAENQSRLAEVEEIRSELIRRGEIQRTWEERLNKEKERGYDIERDFQLVLLEMEEEKMIRNEGLAEYMKKKTSLDYRQQLLCSLRKEVDEMYDRLANERANIFVEQQSLDKLLAYLRNQQDGMVEAKSILEAEKEALRILRYWVEEEAWKLNARGKNLEQAARRWKWSSNSG